ncbi:MAG: ABC transporter substrate-binding protein [Geminicoccaceae bacterium]|nr:MAG: ABC transporter substrate-binding protein [Geminicoccaceae bacterium]
MLAWTRRALAATWLTLVLVGLALPADAVEPGAARAFVGDLADRATAILNSDAADETRRDGLRDLLNEGFDVAFIARSVLGPPFRELSEAQRADYVAAFERWLVASYASRLDEYNGQRLEIVGAEAQGQQDVRVVSRVTGDQTPVRIDWRVRDRDGRLQIIDVEVEGVSMTVSQRQEFSSVVQRRGVDGLIALLRERSASLG